MRIKELIDSGCNRDEPAPAEYTDRGEKLTQEELAEGHQQTMRITDE